MTNTPRVTVGGIPYPVYAVDVSGGGDQASEITIDFVNEGGKYEFPFLNTKQSISIKIGSFYTFYGFPVSATKTEGVGGNFLKIKFVDTSNILDFYYVGLKGKHGEGFNTVVSGDWDRLILLGNQIDPCGTADEILDYCNPCPDAAGSDQENIDCVTNRLIKILDVDYTIEDLLFEVRKFIPVYNVPFSSNINYRQQYTGTLRNVLQSWCADYGWSFYWDENSIRFYDLSTGLNINDSGVGTICTILERQETISIEDNRAIANIFYFGQDGDYKEYHCGANKEWDYAKKLILTPLTLENILANNGVIDPFISTNYLTSLIFEQVLALSIFSEAARDLYVLYNICGIESAMDAESARNAGTVFPAMGNMKIHNVGHSGSTSLDDSFIYGYYLTPGSQTTPFSDSEIAEYRAKNAYIIVAEYSEKIKGKFLKFENSLAENAMGRYWYRYFNADLTNGFDYSTPDGSVNYYKRGDKIQFDFLKDLPSGLTSISSFIRELEQGVGLAIDNFVILDRPQVWLPSPDGDEQVNAFVKDCDSIAFKEITNSGIPKELIKNENYKVFIVFPKTSSFPFEVEATQYTNNAVDSENVNKPFNNFGYIGTYGLRSSRTRGFRVTTLHSHLNIIFPSQSGFTPGVNYGGYAILARGEREKNTLTATIPKTERVLIDVPFQSMDKSIGIDVNYRNVTNNDLLNLTAGCTLNTARIDGYISELARNLKSATLIDKRTITYTLGGLPNSIYRFRDGLVSFSIRIDSSGTKSTLTFSNQFPVRRSEYFTKEDLSYLLKNPSFKKYVQTYITPSAVASTQPLLKQI